MAQRSVVLKGKAQWAKVFEDNRDMKGFEGAYEENDGAYTIDVILDKEEFDKLKATGSIKKGVLTEDGIKVNFVRKHRIGGREYGPPRVKDADGNKWDKGLIGNGSEVEVGLVVYDTKYKGRAGTRLEAIRVVEHVPVEGGAADLPF